MLLKMWKTLFLCLTVHSFAHAGANLPLNASKVVELGTAYDPDFPNVGRDGGGGVLLNGYHVMVYADTSTTNKPNGTLIGFTDNSFAYFGVRNASDPIYLTDFGTNGVPKQAVSNLANETNDASGNRWVIWPNSNMAVTGTNTAVGVWTAGNVKGPTFTSPGPRYNTMVQVTAASTGPTTTRIVPSLFQYGEIFYGSFAVYSTNRYLYLFGSSTDGIKVARVPLTTKTSRSTYTFWNGAAWTSTMPAANDTKSNLFTWTEEVFSTKLYPDSGDIFYDNYHQTFVCVFMDSFVDGLFRMTYATGNSLTSAWAPVTSLYQPPNPPEEWNYSGHAYPGWDATGKTLLLSYSFGGSLTHFAQVTWK